MKSSRMASASGRARRRRREAPETLFGGKAVHDTGELGTLMRGYFRDEFVVRRRWRMKRVTLKCDGVTRPPPRRAFTG
jgi:hypothetical protein